MRHLALLAISVLQIILGVRADGHYTVIGPGTLHSAHEYSVSVAVHHTSAPTQLKVGLTGPSFNETKLVDLAPGEVKTLEFDVPELAKGEYNLTAEGVAGIIFKNTTKLNWEEFNPYVKIETDKGAYRPGELVQYRVLFLDEDLRPAVAPKETVIWFEDAKRNRIKEIKNIESIKGVYTGEFQISEFPVLGGWNLYVDHGKGYPKQAYFKVSKHVLPKYNVKVEATETVVSEDGDLQIVVRSNYTYNEPVDAKVTLLLELSSYYNYFEMSDDEKESARRTPPVLIHSADMVRGKAKFDVNVREYDTFMTNRRASSRLTITATVEENFTGVKINGTGYSTLYPYRYSINCMNYENCSQFTADKEAEVHIIVQHVDGTQINDTKSIVKLSYVETLQHMQYWRMDADELRKNAPAIDNKTIVLEGHLNGTGFAIFNVVLPDLAEIENYTHYYKMNVEYIKEDHEIYNTYQYRKPKDTEPTNEYKEPTDYFKVQPITKEDTYQFELGEKTTFMFNSSEPIPYIVYSIIGRGNILLSERIALPDKPKIYNLTAVAPTFHMMPHATLYAHYVDEKGDLQYAECSFNVKFEYPNQIEISAPEKVKPGDIVPLRIKTAPQSFVGLHAIDQSALMFASHNGVNDFGFQWELGTYNTYTPWQGGYSRYPGDVSGCVTLTNAAFFYNWTSPIEMNYDRSDLSEKEMVVSTPMVPQSVHSTQSHLLGDAVGAAGQGGAVLKRTGITVRKDFSETWIYANIENTETEEFTWSKKIPDTITSWVVSGFSLNPTKGLGVTKDSTSIITFQPFFISIRLPYAVKRGEVINVPALVFNYLEKDLNVEVTLDNTDDEFDFTEASNEVINEQQRTKTVLVPAKSSAGVSFLLRPKTIGNIMLKFTAVSPIAGDAIHKTLKVVPEGVTEYGNRAYFVNLKSVPEFKESFELELPKEVVPDSEHVEFAVVGDMLGPLLKNLDRMVRMPTGCGEQRMSSLMPNYLVLEYLKSIDKLTPEVEARIKRNLEAGYQNILSYRHKDGSFSAFGPAISNEKPYNGSTWLTAYVVRSLNQIRNVIKVDEKILQRGVAYLESRQSDNGSFVEAGPSFFFAAQRSELTLTASILEGLLETQEFSKVTRSHIEKGLKFVLDNFDKTEDLQAQALVTYVLHKAEHAEAGGHLEQLQKVANSEDDRMWWSNRVQKSPQWWRYAYSSDVEITSYMLLMLLDKSDLSDPAKVDEVLPIVKWLVAQRNSYGGFSSTHDTVLGLQALIKFARKSGYEPAVMDIEFTARGDKSQAQSVAITEDNGLLMQVRELPQKTHAIDFHAKGKGSALVQISYQYNIAEKEKEPSFTIDAIVHKDTPSMKLELDVCLKYAGDGETSNMALLEVALPSGYIADAESFEQIHKVDRVRRVESKNQESTIVVYFESLAKAEITCVPIEAFKSFAVAMQKPVPIVVYDYYDTSRRATAYYEVVSKLCDICDKQEDQKCKELCN